MQNEETGRNRPVREKPRNPVRSKNLVADLERAVTIRTILTRPRSSSRVIHDFYRRPTKTSQSGRREALESAFASMKPSCYCAGHDSARCGLDYILIDVFFAIIVNRAFEFRTEVPQLAR
jgi:hypothetical protein